MEEVDNLDTYLGAYFSLFYFTMKEVNNLLEKEKDPMAIIIRVVGLMV